MVDNTGRMSLASGLVALGRVKGGDCNSMISAEKNPCEGYADAIGLFIPVLYDTGDTYTSRIVQLNIVVCKR